MYYKNQKFVLKNGLRVLFIEQSNAKSAALGVAINAGPYFENQGEEGISHLLEHLIGRTKSGGETLREKIYSNQGLLDAATSVSQTFYYLYTYPEKLVGNTDLLLEGVFFPKFTSEALNFSKQSVVSEMAFNMDLSSYEILREMMWKDPRLSRAIVGSKNTMMGATLTAINNYHGLFYSAGNTSVVVIANNFEDDLAAALEKIPVNKDFKLPSVDLSLKKPSYRIYQEGNLHSLAAFSFPTKGYLGLGEDRHIFNIAATALSDIYVMRLGKLGLIYEANWNWNIFPESGDFIILLESIEGNHVFSALKEGLKLITSWHELPLSQKEFELLKSHRILDLRIGASQVDALPLFTRNFSSSEEAHTYEEAIGVYESAKLKKTMETVKEVLLSEIPYTVVSVGTDSTEKLGKINQLMEEYYK